MSDIIYELENISDYILDITQNKLIIKKNLIELTENNYKSFNYTKSSIIDCKLNNSDVSKLKYKSIVLDIWKYLKIISINFRNHTTMKYEEGLRKTNGFQYDKDLNISLQNKDALGTFIEIFNLVKKLDIVFYIKIELENKKIIYLENNGNNKNTINNLEKLATYDFTCSNILNVELDNTHYNTSSYFAILRYIYDLINDKNKILNNTILTIKEGKINKPSYHYFSKYDFSINGNGNNNTVKEIIHICNVFNIKKKIEIELKNNNVIIIN